jgi:DNA-directed RNA polymerase specialized sigma24 family protein
MTTATELDRILTLATVSLGAARGEMPPKRREDAYEVLTHVQAALADLRDAERAAVTLYREHGATWEDVGAAYGMTKQAAWERFGAGS